MKKFIVVSFVIILLFSASSVIAMDIYEWRAETEAMCNSGYQLRPMILHSMAGGRPETLVVNKMREENWIDGLSDGIGTDVNTANIIVRSVIHSMFIDKRLREPINLSRESYTQMFKRCSTAVLKYDPDGSKTERWRNQQPKAQSFQEMEEEAKGR